MLSFEKKMNQLYTLHPFGIQLVDSFFFKKIICKKVCVFFHVVVVGFPFLVEWKACNEIQELLFNTNRNLKMCKMNVINGNWYFGQRKMESTKTMLRLQNHKKSLRLWLFHRSFAPILFVDNYFFHLNVQLWSYCDDDNEITNLVMNNSNNNDKKNSKIVIATPNLWKCSVHTNMECKRQIFKF